MRFLKLLLSVETLFAGFLFSSVFKGVFDNTVIDLTLLFFVLLFVSVIYRILKRPAIRKMVIFPLVIYVMISLLMIVSYLYSPSNIYASEKIIKFISITFFSFLIPLLTIDNKKSIQKFLKATLFFGLGTALIVLYKYLSADVVYSRFGVDGETGNVLGLARLAGITSIILIANVVFGNRFRFISFIMFLVSVFVLLITGSRMPFLALIIAIGLLIALSFRINVSNVLDFRIPKKLVSLIFLSPIMVGVVYLLTNKGYLGSFFKRLSDFGTDGGGSSVIARTNMTSDAFSMWKEAPLFGQGVGSFPLYTWGIDVKRYPHNIFMEFLSELGLIGLLLFIILLLGVVFIFIKSINLNLNTTQTIIVSLFAFQILNTLSTGDVNDNRWLFAFIALMWSLPLYKNNMPING